MGIKTWAVTSKVLERLRPNKTQTRVTENRYDNETTLRANDSSGRARVAAAAARRKSDRLPLAVQILDNPSSVNLQQNSPLFGKLPAELRELIWDYALTGYEDLDSLYPLDKPYARPGQAAPTRVAVELLLTCRAVYLEAFLVPFQVNPITVFDGHPDVIPPNNPLQCTSSNLRLCRKLRPWQFANITSVDLSVQQFTLEGGSIERVARISGNKGRHEGYESRGFTLAGYGSFGPAKQTNSTSSGDGSLRPGAAETRETLIRSIFRGKKVTHLTLRMSRTDWWGWTTPPQQAAGIDTETEPHEALRLEPMINVTQRRETSGAMLEGFTAREEGREPDFNLDEFEMQGRWGMQFAEHWPDLQTFELVLETYAAKEQQLDTVVRCAKRWTFPLRDGGDELRWDGTPESSVHWRGATEYTYDAELGMAWPQASRIRDQERAQAKDAPEITRWRPAVAADGTDPTMTGQEFVIKSLVFTRRRTAEAAVSLDA